MGYNSQFKVEPPQSFIEAIKGFECVLESGLESEPTPELEGDEVEYDGGMILFNEYVFEGWKPEPDVVLRSMYRCKFYYFKECFTELSKIYEGLWSVIVDGEDQGDYYKYYFKDGERQRVGPKFPEPNEEDWR